MAVEIPVVIDIDKAFQDAANRVSSAIKPMKGAIEDATANLQLKVGTDAWGSPIRVSLQKILKDLQKGKSGLLGMAYSAEELGIALGDASGRLDKMLDLERQGANINLTRKRELEEAIVLLTQEIEQRGRGSMLIQQQTQQLIAAKRAEEERRFIIEQEANTMSELSKRLSALQGQLQNTLPGSKEWRQLAADIMKTTEAVERYGAKLERATTKPGSIKRISAEMRELERQWNTMSRTQKFDKDGNIKASAQKVIDKYKELVKESDKYGKSLAQMTAKAKESFSKMASTAVPAVDSVTNKLRTQGGVISLLTTYLSAYTAIFAGLRFIRNVRETTAEFEKQKVALGSIINDTEMAEALFKRIKTAALESPFQIGQLVRYTKQLSAYRIETDKLFDVTMKLADVSAGLGVDMNRLILAYGQVRAAAVLRGQELRQFTEAGIPLVELLAEKFREMGRIGTTTADVFELISKRAVSFEMVAEIFDDMTERGGIFYKMQEKQAETLAGQWSNLKDSLSIMYDEIGNTSVVHNAMTGLIQDAKVLFQNWRLVANSMKIATVAFAGFKAVSLFLPNLRRELTYANKAQRAFARSQELSNYALRTGSKSAQRAAVQMRYYSIQMRKAALENDFLQRSMLRLKAAFAGLNWQSLVIMGVLALGTALASAAIEAGRLQREIKKIGAEGDISINRSVANFKRLADQAVNATDGSKEQAQALDELRRTYSDIIPTQQLELKALRELQGGYESLTRAIREKISEQIREQQVSTITDIYGKKVSKRQTNVKKYMSSIGLDLDQTNAIMDAIQDAIERKLIDINTTVDGRKKFFEDTIKDLTGIVVDFNKGVMDSEGNWKPSPGRTSFLKSLEDLLNVYLKMDVAVRDVNESMADSTGTFGQFAKMSKDMEKELSKIFVDPIQFGKKGTFNYNQERIRQSVEIFWKYIQDAFEDVNTERADKIDISEALLGDGKINFDFIDKAVEEAMAGGQNTRLNTFVNSIKEKYEELIPSNKIVNLVRTQVTELANQYGVSMDTAQQYFKKAETSMEDYVKSLQEAAKEHKSLLLQMEMNNKKIEEGHYAWAKYTDEELEAERSTNQFLDALLKVFDAFAKHTGKGGGYTQDPFIAQMQERMRFMEDFKKGYDDLNKYISKSDALAEQAAIMEERGLSLGISPEEQKSAAEGLADWYKKAMDKVFEQAKTHGAKGTIESFLSEQIKDTSKNGRALKDFQKLLQSLWDARTDLKTDEKKKEWEEALERLSNEIKQTEAARNFYTNILDITGDEKLAASMSVSVYGNIGDEFKQRIQKQLDDAMETVDADKLTDELKNALKTQDFDVILQNLDKFPKEWQKRLKEMAEADQKYSSDLLKNFANLIAKYGDTSQKVATIKAKAENEINKVKEAFNNAVSSQKLTPEERKALEDRMNEVIKAIEATRDLDIFKQSDDYVKFFSEITIMTAEQAAKVRGDLRNAYLKAFQDGAISADELRRNLRAIDEQTRKLSEDSTLLGAYLSGGFEKANKKLQDYADNIAVLAAKMKSGKGLDEQEQVFATRMLQAFGSGKTKGINSYQQLIDSFAKNGEGLKEAGAAFGEMGEGMGAMAAEGPGALAIVDAIIKGVNSTITGIQQIIDQLNEVRSEENQIGDWFKYVSDFNKYAFSGWEKLKSGDAIGATVDVISSVISIFNNAQRDKIKRYNKKIEEQEELLKGLTYSYGRLEKAMEKAFGSDYIYNYNEQLKNLQAQQAAYEEQLRLEQKKGKSTDKKKVKEYEESIQEVKDQILEMEGGLSEFFAGSDVKSAAEEFADSWIEAYKSFGSTTSAMQEKFQEMIGNMITQSLAGKMMQSLLQPIFDEIDRLSADGELTAAEIGSISDMATAAIPQIDAAMTGLVNNLAGAGINLRQQAGQFTGISRDIAGASEESILGLAAAVNTANFYISHVPTINDNVAAIREYLTGDTTGRRNSAATRGEVEGPTYEDQMLSYAASIPQMRDDMSVMRSLLERVIKPLGVSATHYVAVR